MTRIAELHNTFRADRGTVLPGWHVVNNRVALDGTWLSPVLEPPIDFEPDLTWSVHEWTRIGVWEQGWGRSRKAEGVYARCTEYPVQRSFVPGPPPPVPEDFLEKHLRETWFTFENESWWVIEGSPLTQYKKRRVLQERGAKMMAGRGVRMGRALIVEPWPFIECGIHRFFNFGDTLDSTVISAEEAMRPGHLLDLFVRKELSGLEEMVYRLELDRDAS